MEDDHGFTVGGFLVGQLCSFIGSGLVSASEARETMLRIANDDDLWRKIPAAIRNFEQALPAIHAGIELDTQQRPPRSGSA